MTHSRMMQSLATCFLSTLPSPPPPPPRFPWPPLLLGLFIPRFSPGPMNRGTEGVWVTRTLATRALAARCYRRICIIAAAVVYFRRAHLVGLYSGGRRQRLASLPSTFPPNGCLLVLVPTVHALCVSTLVGRRKAADWA